MPRAFRSLLLCEIRQRSKSQTSTQSLTIRPFFYSAVIFPASSSQNQSSSSSQMKPNSPFILFCLTLLSYVSNLSLSADQYPQNCYPQNCSHLTNIAYPFWIRSLQPDYCGLPPFELNCSDETPTLFMGKEHYRVLNISYKAQTLTVATAAGEECSFPLNDLSFDLTPFTVSLSNRQLIIAYNCTLATGAGTTEIDCASGRKRFAFLGGNYGAPTDEGMFGSCRTVARPVMGYLGAKVEEYHELLANGFLLNWTAPDCTECRKSNGQCGYDNNTSNFMCICPDRAHFRSCSKEHSKKGLIIGVSTAVGVCLFMVCLVLCFLLYVYRKKNKRMSSTLLDSTASFQLSKSDPELGGSLHAPIFTYDELYEATDSFHASKELGDGGFGTVYKGKLRDGRVVAVKRLYESNYRRLDHFINEVKILSRLRHQNLVSLYGCTSRRSRELLLVYEFVPNGTVADHLHGPQSSGLLLPWKVRMSIAIETADALNYLHSVEPQIIHRDVKTNNILLDDSFHVKVADFGLSRLFPLDATHVSTAPQGTPGYLDPDYYQCYQLTVKSDVYSFGVVLMELISSMPAVDISLPRNEINLANRAINKIQSQELHELVDPRLGYQSDPSVNRMISQVAELAFQCLQSDGEMRPCIKDVLELLRGIACFGCEKVSCEEEDAALKEEDQLLESPLPCSPKSVTQGWVSRSTTPNTSW